MKNITVYSFLFLITLLFIVGYYYKVHRQADFGMIGKFEYKIIDIELFNKTFLTSDSYGYLITDSAIQGLEITNFDFKNNNTDLIISTRPIRSVYINSKRVANESENTAKKPVEIIKDSKKNDEQYVYIYYLKPKDRYRLLLP